MIKSAFQRAVSVAAGAVLLGILLPTTGSAHDQATFEVTITNVASGDTLRLPDGRATGAPIAPGMYAVVADGVTLLSTANQPAMPGSSILPKTAISSRC